MTSVLRELYRHKTWATLRLIEFCQSLPPEHVEATLPGTYGSVRATLIHLANSEANYYSLLVGQPRPTPIPLDGNLQEAHARISQLGPGWEALVDQAELPDKEFHTPMGFTTGAAPLGQAIHHADDHRTQVLSILGSRGLELPSLDFWDYGTEAGFVRPAVPAT
ncbi:MAG: DinB family protein [Chloroflexi bacterium]|nr:DinB family protein [Chloroflexota bacterium]